LFSHANQDVLKSSYTKAADFLELSSVPEIGVSILLGDDWMLVAPLTDPVSTRGSVPHYLEAIAYVGVLNVNFEEDEWPQTAKVDLVK